MSFAARVFRVLIASPSDVTDEREIAVSTIQAWNDLNSAERQIVLLPLRWETHSAPEYGRRPQEVINRQVVDHCDLLVGVFWTRIGSPTGLADSGTLEEIERVATQGKPVMLYFSLAKQDPDHIDLEQLQRLREFKKKTFPKALVESYTSQIEFRDKLAKQLEIQLRTLLAEENQLGGDVSKSTPTTELQFAFANPQTGAFIGPILRLQNNLIQVEDLDDLPDYEDESSSKLETSEAATGFVISPFRENKDYYRDMAAYVVRQGFFRPIRFWLKNVGGVGARDVYVDIRITSDDPELTVLPLSEAGLSPPKQSGILFYGRGSRWDEESDVKPEKVGNQWTTQLELRALQPQREVSPEPRIVIGAKKSGPITITARIYADTVPQPVTRTLEIHWVANEVRKKATDLLEEAGVKIGSNRLERKAAAE